MKTIKELASQIKRDIHSIERHARPGKATVIRKCNSLDWHSPEAGSRILRHALSISNHYADYLGVPHEHILNRMEEMRINCERIGNWSPNFYQRCHWPKLTNIPMYDTKEDFFKVFPSKLYICPACGGESNDPYKCDTGLEINPGKICDWKAYGLFGCLGKSYTFIIKEEFRKDLLIRTIFRPKELISGD